MITCLKKFSKTKSEIIIKTTTTKAIIFYMYMRRKKKTYEIFGFQKTLIKKVKQSLLF